MSRSNQKRPVFAIIIIIFILTLGEVTLRELWGFANAPLYQDSDKYEYVVCPNQDGYRFGNHYHYNSFSQRCEEPDTTKKIILGLGDSVIFGGATTDQDSLATTLFSKETGCQMLNISAGSWGPDNCAAYLKENGLFGAVGMFLLVSSHDAYDNMDFKKVVGVHNSYPDTQYVFAWGELLFRYVWPRISEMLSMRDESADPDQKVLNEIGIHKKGKLFNPGFAQLKIMADSAGIPLYVCLHAEKPELFKKEYNEQGQEIIRWCERNNIILIKDIEEGISEKMYRDDIHFNEKGQRFVADLIKKHLCGLLTK